METLTPSLEVKQSLLPSETTKEPPASNRDSEYNLVRLNGTAFARVLRDCFVVSGRSNSPSSNGSSSSDGLWDFRHFVLDHDILSQCRGCSRRGDFCESDNRYRDGPECACVWQNCQSLKSQDGRLVDADVARDSSPEPAPELVSSESAASSSVRSARVGYSRDLPPFRRREVSKSRTIFVKSKRRKRF